MVHKSSLQFISSLKDRSFLAHKFVSWLTTIYATAFTEYVSLLCNVGIKAGAGLAAGFSCLIGGDEKAAKISAINQKASLAGAVCDGAKPGCSLKVASGVETAYRSAVLAKKGLRPPQLDGIIGDSLEETLMNVIFITPSHYQGALTLLFKNPFRIWHIMYMHNMILYMCLH